MATYQINTRQDLLQYKENVTLDGLQFELTFRYNLREGYWYLDVSDIEGTVIRYGLKLITNHPLLRTVKVDDRPPGQLVVVDPTEVGLEAGRYTLGTDLILVYVDEDDI